MLRASTTANIGSDLEIYDDVAQEPVKAQTIHRSVLTT